MSVAAFIEKSLAAESPEILFESFLDTISAYGIDRVMYGALRNTHLNNTDVPIISYSYPDDWVGHYVSNEYISKDPACLTCYGTRNAFMWSDMVEQKELSSTQSSIMNQGEEAGLLNGITVPFHGPMGELFAIGLASSSSNPDVGVFIKEIQALATQFHFLNTAFFDQTRADGIPVLTPREREVLKWCAAGKTSWCISEILGISEHGVEFHMRNIMKKFDAETRVTAVVKGLQSGQITL